MRIVYELWRIAFDSTNGFWTVEINFILILCYVFPWKTEVCDLYVHFFVKKDVLGFDVAMCKAFFMKMANSSNELFENESCSFFWEDLRLVDEAEQFSVLGYFHDVVHDPVYFAIDRAIYSADIEVYNLNNVSMFCLQADLYLVYEHCQWFLFVPSLNVILLNFVIHYFYRHSLVIWEFQSHLDPGYWAIGYFENLPEPNLNSTLYFSSIVGQSSRYSMGRSRRNCIL